jgi:hypothetical protein
MSMASSLPSPNERPPNEKPLSDDEISLLAEFSKALLPTHGAAAVSIVKKVTDETRSVRDIVRRLAGFIDDETKRALFVRRAKLAVETLRERKLTATQELAKKAERRRSALTTEQMACAEDALSSTFGPKASVLVARYASSTDTSRDFFEQLSTHLTSLKERAALFKAARKLSRTKPPEEE